MPRPKIENFAILKNGAVHIVNGLPVSFEVYREAQAELRRIMQIDYAGMVQGNFSIHNMLTGKAV